jgi:hypothetical protein
MVLFEYICMGMSLERYNAAIVTVRRAFDHRATHVGGRNGRVDKRNDDIVCYIFVKQNRSFNFYVHSILTVFVLLV